MLRLYNCMCTLYNYLSQPSWVESICKWAITFQNVEHVILIFTFDGYSGAALAESLRVLHRAPAMRNKPTTLAATLIARLAAI